MMVLPLLFLHASQNLLKLLRLKKPCYRVKMGQFYYSRLETQFLWPPWFVKKSWGGGLAFLHMNPAALEEMISDENPASLLAYVNSDHEYILFDPYGAQACERGVTRRHSLGGFQETGQFGYSSIYVEATRVRLEEKSDSANHIYAI
ncbi:hypothetical protein Acr_00g0095200 [Actinidia rufa]|uniref:Uncharacterized protein n=1 Tax=Actinidia rufa TaxID=165716 RepID=A0A7J0DY94_9ERIC|nr:hypothetical protein Acr_00g0095200 [Actinidia rufa]